MRAPRRALGAAAAVLAAGGAAGAAADDRGFSYFMGLGRQTVSQQEAPSVVPARSHARAGSPLLITGALYAVSADQLLSLDGEATFAPGTTTERWTATAGSIGGTPLTDSLLQSNRFSVQQNTTRLLGLQRVSGAWFATAGAAFHSHSFRRYAFVAGPDNAVTLPRGAVNESVSELQLSLGLALESEAVRNTGQHFGLRAGVARPVWRRVQNTAFPDHNFNGTGGWDLSLSGRWSMAVWRDVHLGAWGQVVRGERSGQVAGNVELPRTKTTTAAYGLELLWKL